jgi:hypothetical protein
MNPLTNPSGYPLRTSNVQKYTDMVQQARLDAMEKAIRKDEEHACRLTVRAGKRPKVTEEEDPAESAHQLQMYNIKHATTSIHLEDEQHSKRETEKLH